MQLEPSNKLLLCSLQVNMVFCHEIHAVAISTGQLVGLALSYERKERKSVKLLQPSYSLHADVS